MKMKYADLDKVNEIATEDAAEALHELSDDDFINVVAELIKRRTYSDYPRRNSIIERIDQDACG